MIIDFHTHIFPRFFRNERQAFFDKEPTFADLYRSPKSNLAGRDAILRDMDEGQVQKSVVFGFPWESEDYFHRHNDYIIESVQKQTDRLIGFGCFSLQSSQGWKEAERCLEAGLSGVGELAFYHSHFDDKDIESLKDIMGVCAQYDVPIILHTNEPVGHHYPGKTEMSLSRLYYLLKEYPSNKIVLAHWGGGLFFYGLMKKEVKEALRNVWFDTAASPYLYRPDVYRIAAEIVGLDRILLGSDYPLLKPGRYLEEMASVNLPERTIQKISGENAATLLGLT
jgi:predicted TIM-barrel fold metal-dependent hydrolase